MVTTGRRSATRVLGLTVAGVLALTACADDGGDPEPGADAAPPATVDSTPTGGASATSDPVAATGAETGAETDAGPGTDPEATDTLTAVRTQTGTVDADEAPEPGGTDADTEPDTAEASGTPPVLVDVRVGSHAGHDRVVWEFADGGAPGWRAEYVDDPARQGSGATVELPGEATLAVTIEGVGAPFEAPDDVEAYLSSDRIAAASTSVITEVVPGGWFEGYVDGFVGVTTEQPFRVRLFEDPTRVVLDVEQ